VGNGNIDVGNESPTRKPGQPSGNVGSSELRIDSSLKKGRCGAMSQQGGEFRGNVSAPQEFLHLVGCRDGKAAQKQLLQKQILEKQVLEKQVLEKQVLDTTQYPNRVKR